MCLQESGNKFWRARTRERRFINRARMRPGELIQRFRAWSPQVLGHRKCGKAVDSSVAFHSRTVRKLPMAVLFFHIGRPRMLRRHKRVRAGALTCPGRAGNLKYLLHPPKIGPILATGESDNLN